MIILAEGEVKKDESFEAMMRRFKKQVEQEGILRQIRDRQHFETPSERRRKKSRTKGRR